MLLLTDELGNTCYYGVTEYINLDYNTLVAGGALFENVLFNAGFMFTDIIELILNNPSTVTDYSYFVGYRTGDFFIRFFYKDTTVI